ncbi:MAG TPA: MFS transporter [Acetobacteraceae bacterium]|nr:MFS transporter [Acetobacteraceae bacterium]
MGPQTAARVVAGRVHYAWVIVTVMFVVIVASVGVRAAPSVLIVPLQRDFGWSVATISGAVSLNIALFGLVGPFAAALLRTIGLKRTLLMSMALLVLGAGSSAFITQIWQLYFTWGVLVGVGSGAGMVGLATAIANRWFVERRGLVIGLLTAGNASGQLVFLPILASLAQSVGWRSVPWTVAIVILLLMPVVMLLLAEEPAAIGLAPFGGKPEAAQPPPAGNPVRIALEGLGRGARSVDFWLLSGTFAVCGFSTYGLVATHLIPYCADHGIAPVQAASLLAAMGVFDLIGTTASGWLTDRYNPRVLLFWYYGLRGLSLLALPFSGFDLVSLLIFAVFYGLDWVATVPPTVALTTSVFGKRDAPVMVSWIVAAHQLGGAIAAIGAGEVRSISGTYTLAFIGSGFACMIASLLVLRIARRPALAMETA